VFSALVAKTPRIVTRRMASARSGLIRFPSHFERLIIFSDFQHPERSDGTLWEKVVTWFGYKLHLIVDAVYELPVGFTVTRASASDVKEGHKLIERVAGQNPEIIDRCEALAADKACDDTKLIMKLLSMNTGSSRLLTFAIIGGMVRKLGFWPAKRALSMIIVVRSTVTVPGRTNAAR